MKGTTVGFEQYGGEGKVSRLVCTKGNVAVKFHVVATNNNESMPVSANLDIPVPQSIGRPRKPSDLKGAPVSASAFSMS